MDLPDKLATFGLGISSLLASAFYQMYCNRHKTSEAVRKTENMQLNDLPEALYNAPDNKLSYVTLYGIVQPFFQKLQSAHGTMDGVVKVVQKTEHRSRRNQGYWSDAKRIIQNTFDSVPFKLVEPHTANMVNVTEVESAEFLQDELTITYDHFDPEKSSLLKTGIDRMFGEVTKGFQATEKMLLVGTHLCGIGEVYMEHGKPVLGPPSNGGQYILTKLSKGAVVRKLDSQAFAYKVWTVIFGSVSVGLFVFLVYKFVRWYRERRKNLAIYAEIRAAANLADNEGRTDNPDQQCVVCLSNPRSVIVMDCRHVCLCTSCAELLPHPRKCPICRQPADQFLPLYQA